jgi:two-component system, cell cycle sensor histidine kinase and response regulator CckA
MSSCPPFFSSSWRSLLLIVIGLFGLQIDQKASLWAAQNDLEPVRLQLKYYHQFQFAGFYAADLKGYYAAEKLSVSINELQPGLDTTQTVLTSASDFAITNAGILQNWARGDDLFLLAFIQQKNPHAIFVRRDSALETIADLAKIPKERLIGPSTFFETDIAIGLSQLGYDPLHFFTQYKKPHDFTRFVNGELDIYPGFISNELHRFREAKVDVRTLNILPRSTIIPGDALICSGALWRGNPRLVERFRRASLKGWEYALGHPQEIIEHILATRHSAHQSITREHLQQEANTTTELIDMDRFPMGDINMDRLQSIVALLRDARLPGKVREDLIFETHHPLKNSLFYGSLIFGIVVCVTLALLYITRNQHRSLTESRHHYQNLIESADGFFAFRARLINERECFFEAASRSIEVILGYPLAHYQNDTAKFILQLSADDQKTIAEHFSALLQERQGRIRTRVNVKHPQFTTPRTLLINATALHTTSGLYLDGIAMDLTSDTEAEHERAKLQAQLQSAQQNESLGLLASGVAHDFNNILSAIRGNAELVSRQVPTSHQHRMDRLFQAVDRASGLVRQILAYSGRGRIESKPLNLAEELKQIDELLKHALPAQVTTTLTLTPELPFALFDPAQFQQVIVNLIVNAAESYEGKPGVVHIILDLFHDKIRIRVIDNGCGMDKGTIERIFDPYFTTKERGHGLGLAAVKGILKNARGSIHCDSLPGTGTTFTLLFPSCANRPVASQRSPIPELPAGTHFILVVDDDVLVRDMTVDMLNASGHQCLSCSGGKAALEILAHHRARITLMIIDCRMPDIDGITVVSKIRESGDRLPIILISGMVSIENIGTRVFDRRTRFLAKPFSGAQLASNIDSLFGSQSKNNQLDDSSRTAKMIVEVIRKRQEDDNKKELEQHLRENKNSSR